MLKRIICIFILASLSLFQSSRSFSQGFPREPLIKRIDLFSRIFPGTEPVVLADKIIFINKNGKLVSLDEHSYSIGMSIDLYLYYLSHKVGSPVMGQDGKVYVFSVSSVDCIDMQSSGALLHIVSPNSGSVNQIPVPEFRCDDLGRSNMGRRDFYNPILIKDYLIIATMEGVVHSIDTISGNIVWKKNFYRKIISQPILSEHDEIIIKTTDSVIIIKTKQPSSPPSPLIIGVDPPPPPPPSSSTPASGGGK